MKTTGRDIVKLCYILFITAACTGFFFNSASAERCSSDGWCLQTPKYEGGDIRDVWFSRTQDIFVANNTDEIMHFDGTEWKAIKNPHGSYPLGQIWGTSPTDIYVGSSNSIMGGMMYHYDGTDWTPIGGTGYSIYSIWGTSSTNIYFAGGSNYIEHYDGTNRTSIQVSSDSGVMVLGMWGTAANNIYAVGSKGRVIRFDGTTWGQEPIPAGFESTFFQAVWGSSASNIFVVGQNGVILRWNGIAWSQLASGTTERLRGVWGSSATDIYFAGEGGTLIHYDGLEMKPVSTGTEFQLNGICGRNENDFYVYGWQGSLINYKDKVRTWMAPGYGNSLQAVYGSSKENIFAAGLEGTIIHYDGSEWKNSVKMDGLVFRGLWGSADGSRFFATGDNGAMAHYRDGVWNKVEIDTDYNLYGIWGTAEDNVYAAGIHLSGYGAIMQYDGNVWRLMHSAPFFFQDIWAASPSDIFAVAKDGGIIHYDGQSWTAMSSGTSGDISSVWGASGSDVYAVVDNNSLIHYDGVSWKSVDTGLGGIYPYDIWGSSGTDIFVASIYYVLHFDGLRWVSMATGATAARPTKQVNAIWGASSGDVFAAGHSATVLKYSGTAPIYSVSGTVTGPATEGVPVVLSGDDSQITQTDSDGKFYFPGLSNGDYFVTLISEGYTFTPSPAEVTINSNSETIAIASSVTPLRYSVGGSVSGDIIPGVLLTLSGDAANVTLSDMNGDFSFSGLEDGIYTVTPSKAGITFTPEKSEITISGDNVSAVDFQATALPDTWSITGIITGDSPEGVIIKLSGTVTAAAVSASDGSYSFSGLPNGDYTLTPIKDGFAFHPASQEITINDANRTGIEFAAATKETVPESSGGSDSSGCFIRMLY